MVIIGGEVEVKENKKLMVIIGGEVEVKENKKYERNHILIICNTVILVLTNSTFSTNRKVQK